MNRTQKAEFVSDFATRMAETPFLALVDYRGASVEITETMRRLFDQHGVEFRVVKNTLAKRALEGTDKADLTEHFQGMTGVVLSGEDAIASAKVIRDALFAKDSPFEVKAGFFEGDVIDGAGVKAVADLPSREELLSMLLRTIQEPPRRVLNVLQAPARDLLYLLKNYETKLADGEDGN
jgi:large subunit ribosomal protein L10